MNGLFAGSYAYVMPIVALAAILRIAHLGKHELWLDEANAVLIAQVSLGDLIERLIYDSHPPIYFILLRGWMQIFGDGEVAVRMLSVIAGVGAVVLIYFLGSLVLGRLSGILAALLLALSPLHVYYSQEARPYTILTVLILATFFFLYMALRLDRWAWWIGYAISSILAVYVHNWCLFILPVPNIVLLLVHRKVWHRRLAVVQAIIAASYAPFIPIILKQMVLHGNDWILVWWENYPPALAVPMSLEAFSFGAKIPYVLYQKFSAGDSPARIVSIITFSLLSGYSLYSLFRSSRTQRIEIGALLLCFLFAPLAGGWIVSAVLQPIYVVGRHDVLVLPFYLLIVAHGINALKRPGLYTMVAVVCILAFTGLVPYYSKGPSVELRQTARFLARAARPGDYVLFTDLCRPTVEYYLGKRSSALVLASYPRCLERHPSWYNYERVVGEVETLRRDAIDIVREAGSSLGEGGALWVVYERRDRFRAIPEFLEDSLVEMFDKVAEHHIGWVQIHKYSSRRLGRKVPGRRNEVPFSLG